MTKSKRRKFIRKIVDANKGNFPGRHLSIEELKILSRDEDKEACGWIRNHTYDGDSFYGTCALLDFNSCEYPCTLPSWKYQGKYDNCQCPVYKDFIKKRRA